MANYVENYNGGVQFKTGASQGMTVDINGNVGVGVTPSAWNMYNSIQLNGGSIYSNSNASATISIASNTVGSSTAWELKYKTTGQGATNYSTYNGSHTWDVAPSGTAGNSITWTNAMTLNASGNLLLTSGTGALGYGTGAGGTVTQLTSKSTAVALDKPTGLITMSSAALAAGASVKFSLTNSLVTNKDIVIPVIVGGVSANDTYRIETSFIYTGSIVLKLTNVSAGSLSEAVQIQFVVIKGAIA